MKKLLLIILAVLASATIAGLAQAQTITLTIPQPSDITSTPGPYPNWYSWTSKTMRSNGTLKWDSFPSPNKKPSPLASDHVVVQLLGPYHKFPIALVYIKGSQYTSDSIQGTIAIDNKSYTQLGNQCHLMQWNPQCTLNNKKLDSQDLIVGFGMPLRVVCKC